MYVTCRSGWSTEGCERVSVSLSHVSCRCSHLTAFAAILPAAAFEVSDLQYIPVEYYIPSLTEEIRSHLSPGMRYIFQSIVYS